MSSVKKYTRLGRDNERWRARYRDPDGREHVRDFRKKADADLWIKVADAAILKGEWVDPTLGRETFADYAARWADDQQHWRPSTRRATLDRLRVHVHPVIGSMPLARIRRSDTQNVINTAAATLAPSTVSIVRSAMVSVLKAAVLDGLITRNPAVGLRLPKPPPRARMVPLTMGQVGVLADSMPEPYATMVRLGAATGMRSGELRAVRLSALTPPLHLLGDVLPAHVTITVDASLGDDGTLGPVKTAAGAREVTVGPATTRMLADHIAAHGVTDDGLLFHVNRAPISRPRAGHAWRAGLTASGIAARPRSGWHDLRHAAASTWLSAGVPLATVSKRLGHASPAETLTAYAWALPDDDTRLIALADTALGG